MSALGQKQTYAVQNGMSALPPKSGHMRCTCGCPLGPSGHHAPSFAHVCSYEQRPSGSKPLIGQ